MYNVIKRIIDVCASFVGLVICTPLFIVTAVLIKLDSPGPAIYTQKRLKKGGEEFEIIKFRTMLINAEEVLRSNPALWQEYQREYKIKNDPRVTRIGNFLRKSSIDELPQLVNILLGDMSLVGPRAYRKEEIEHQMKTYPKIAEQIKVSLTIKPGLTGVWQVSGRSNVSFEERIKMDCNYAKRKSIRYDLYLILLTIPAVLKTRGAW